MYKGKSILALIPARGGSKGLLRKNILPLSGKPLIAWTIEQAKASAYLDKVIVSTDDAEIAEISRRFGAEVPFMRPEKLASDGAKAMDVIIHAIERLEGNGDIYDLTMLLQPTSPLRTAGDIDRAIELLFLKNAGAVVSVCETEHHPFWSNMLPPDGNMKDFLRPDVANKNRQELPVFYRLNGAIYLASVEYLKTNSGFMSTNTYAYIMPKEHSIDIDTKMDFQFAEFLMQRLLS